jgi:hypothetical protein
MKAVVGQAIPVQREQLVGRNRNREEPRLLAGIHPPDRNPVPHDHVLRFVQPAAQIRGQPVRHEIEDVRIDRGVPDHEPVTLLAQHVADADGTRNAAPLGFIDERDVVQERIAAGQKDDGIRTKGRDPKMRLLRRQPLRDRIDDGEMEPVGIQTSRDHQEIERLPVVGPLRDVAAKLIADVQAIAGGIEEKHLPHKDALNIR